VTTLAGLGIATTGLLVVFGALTGRLAAMVAAVAKPSDLATSGSYVNGTPDFGHNAANEADADTLLMGALVKQVRQWGANKDPEWKNTVEPLVIKATQTRKPADYDKAIAALRTLIAKYKAKVAHATGTGG
jgi:hypothetical protein